MAWQAMSSNRSLYDLGTRFAINALNMVHPDVRNIEAALLRRGGQTVFKYGGMSNGVGQFVTDVRNVARPGSVEVLRIWSHGGSGGQGLSTMPGVSAKGQRAGISLGNWQQIDKVLEPLKAYFTPAGRLELRGCEVGVGLDGDAFLLELARLLKVPVYAAQNPQPIGPIEWAGPVVSMKPDGSRSVTSGKPV